MARSTFYQMTKTIGIYNLGFERVELRTRTTPGGTAALCPVDGNSGRITIGVHAPEWGAVWSLLIHEAMEYALERLGACYIPSNDFTGDSEACFFSFDHQKFNLACQMVGEFTAAALPALRKEWERAHGGKAARRG